jgi:hypothetical protein
VSATGERCELQHFHPFARHQANIAVGNRKPIVEWPVTEWDCSTGRMGLLRQVADLQSQIETLTASIGSVILCAQQDSKVNPQFAGGLQPIIELLQEAQLAAGGRSEGRATWLKYAAHRMGCAVGFGRCEWRESERGLCNCGLADAMPLPDPPSASGEDQ